MNVVIAHINSVSSVAIFAPILLRILLGRLSINVLVGVYYLLGFVCLLTLVMLTVKALLATAFITHFDLMSSFLDQTVLLWAITTSVLVPLTHVLVEVSLKTHSGSGHIGHMNYFTFLGAEDADTNPAPWAIISFTVAIAVYALALAFFLAVKYRRNRRSQGILESNQTSRLESSANGMTAMAMVAILVMAVVFVVMLQYNKKVGRLIGPLEYYWA